MSYGFIKRIVNRIRQCFIGHNNLFHASRFLKPLQNKTTEGYNHKILTVHLATFSVLCFFLWLISTKVRVTASNVLADDGQLNLSIAKATQS